MQHDRPNDAPPGNIRINPEQGFGPHMAEAFLERYGEDSIFVTATVDCLTWRFIGVLTKAGELPAGYDAIQYGPPEMREALEALLKALSAYGMDKPVIALMRSATGHEQPQAFELAVAGLLGNHVMDNWLHLIEKADYAGATALLVVH